MIARTLSDHIDFAGGIPLGNQIYGAKHAHFDADDHCRTQAQFEAVKRYFEENPFEFWSHNSFAFDIGSTKKYSCTFFHLFYVDGQFKAIKVTATGRIFEMNTESRKWERWI